MLVDYLGPRGFAAENAPDAAQGLALLARRPFDAVILDVMLPDVDGFEVCRRLRAFSDVPVLMLTARGDPDDRVVGLELGADDYLPKPFEPRELLARLQTVLRRARTPSTKGPLVFDGLTIDLERRQVQCHARAVDRPRTGLDLPA